MKKRARARNTDPQTSHDAAASVTNISEKQSEVLREFRRLGGLLTDEVLLASYSGLRQTPSGLRTRRAELVELGFLVDSGGRRATVTGRLAIEWQLKPR